MSTNNCGTGISGWGCFFQRFASLLTVALVVICIFSINAEAERYELRSNNPSGNHTAGKAQSFYGSFDTETSRLVWNTVFVPEGGRILEGYWLVIGYGPNPKNRPGEYAIFYVDFTTPTQPKITVYGYGGQNNVLSYRDGDGVTGGEQAPDRILSSLVDSSWIHQLRVTDARTGSGTLISRAIDLDVDLTRIRSHIPRYPDPATPWYGAGFGDKESPICGAGPHLGLWFHPAIFTGQPSYCQAGSTQYPCGAGSTGFLKTFPLCYTGWYDWQCSPVNTSPACTQITGTIQAQVGIPVSLDITGLDDDGDDLTLHYSGQPPGSVTSPVSGVTQPAPLTFQFDWTPSIAQVATNYNVNVTFTDEHAASVSCPFALQVPPNQPPVCNLGVGPYTGLSCQGVQTQVVFDVSGAQDPENQPLTFDFTTTCEGGVAQITQSSLTQAVLTLNEPGLGNDVSCSVSMTVSDGVLSSSCSAQVEVDGCSLDCLGQPNGTAQLDQCGVCNGTNSCLDCESTPFGGKTFDLCGVCGGTNACLDCAGQPFGIKVLDRCGVCEGDGQSCLGCTSRSLEPLQLQLDGNSNRQKALVKRASRTFHNLTGESVKGLVRRANKLALANWSVTFSAFPSVAVTCSNSILCESVDNTPGINAYLKNSAALKRIARRIASLISVSSDGQISGRKIRRQAAKFHKDSQKLAAEIPASVSSCN